MLKEPKKSVKTTNRMERAKYVQKKEKNNMIFCVVLLLLSFFGGAMIQHGPK